MRGSLPCSSLVRWFSIEILFATLTILVLSFSFFILLGTFCSAVEESYLSLFLLCHYRFYQWPITYVGVVVAYSVESQYESTSDL